MRPLTLITVDVNSIFVNVAHKVFPFYPNIVKSNLQNIGVNKNPANKYVTLRLIDY